MNWIDIKDKLPTKDGWAYNVRITHLYTKKVISRYGIKQKYDVCISARWDSGRWSDPLDVIQNQRQVTHWEEL